MYLHIFVVPVHFPLWRACGLTERHSETKRKPELPGTSCPLEIMGQAAPKAVLQRGATLGPCEALIFQVP